MPETCEYIAKLSKSGRAHAVGDSFSNGHASGPADHWLSSLERVDSPQIPSVPSPSTPHIVSPPASATVPARPPSSAGYIASPRPVTAGPTSPLALSAINGKEVEDLRHRLEEQTQALSRLEQERNSLSEAAERLKQAETRMLRDYMHLSFY